MSERRIRIDLAYDGTEFHGWQVQPDLRTVQGTLEEALTRLQGDRPARARGAGRTDAGVHARGQVADTLIRSRLSDAEIVQSLRGMLPADLRPLRVSTVPDGFDAQRSARSKCYRYGLDLTAHGDPFRQRYAMHYPHAIDRSVLQAALDALPGTRDWSGFTAGHCVVENRVRTLTEARYDEGAAGEASFVFSADGFLTYMVRNLVGTLLEIAGGRMPLGRVFEVLETGDRSRAGATFPAHGLCLDRVAYNGP